MYVFREFEFIALHLALLFTLMLSGAPKEDYAEDGLQQETPRVRAEPERLDFGEVFSGEAPCRVLTIKNAGEGDLVLQKIGFNCGCTLSSITFPSGKRVAPGKEHDAPLGTLKSGESAEMAIEFGTRGILGEITRNLKIYTNDPGSEELSLEMKIHVKKPFRLEPEFIDFGTIEKGGSTTRTLKVWSAGVGGFKIKGVTGLPDYMAFEGERKDDPAVPARILIFRMDGTGPAGYRRHKLRLLVENEKVDGIDFFADGTILSDLVIRFNPRGHQETLDLGKVTRSRGGSGSIEILGRDAEKSFTLRRVQVLCKYKDFVQTKIETVRKGSHYKIVLTLAPDIQAAFVQGTLLLDGDHQDLRRKKLKFIARLIDREAH